MDRIGTVLVDTERTSPAWRYPARGPRNFGGDVGRLAGSSRDLFVFLDPALQWLPADPGRSGQHRGDDGRGTSRLAHAGNVRLLSRLSRMAAARLLEFLPAGLESDHPCRRDCVRTALLGLVPRLLRGPISGDTSVPACAEIAGGAVAARSAVRDPVPVQSRFSESRFRLSGIPVRRIR